MTPSMEILNKYDTDEQRIAALAAALDDLEIAYRAAVRAESALRALDRRISR